MSRSIRPDGTLAITGIDKARQALRDIAAWPRRPRVIDATMLFNHIDMLDIRFHELAPHVDVFVIVEANLTHAGVAKPWFFPAHRARFAAFADKIFYWQVDLGAPRPRATETERLDLEMRQRDAIGDALAALGLARKDIVIISDSDEIARGARVAELPARLANAPVCSFIQINHRGYINSRATGGLNRHPWVGPVACRYRLFLHARAHDIRFHHGAAARPLEQRYPGRDYIEDGGWHFSSFGGARAVMLKGQHFCHVEDRHALIRTDGPTVPIQVFDGAIDREEARAAQAEYLARGGVNDFTPLGFDSFQVDDDLPAYLLAERRRFRSFFFFTDLA